MDADPGTLTTSNPTRTRDASGTCQVCGRHIGIPIPVCFCCRTVASQLGLPLVPINEERCPGLREGGWLLELMLKVPVFVHGPEVPEALYMDLRGKRVGDKVMASELDLAPGVVLRSRERDFAVAKIVGSRRGGASAGEEEEPAKVKVNEKKEKEKTSTLEKK